MWDNSPAVSAFERFVLRTDFPCVGGKASLKAGGLNAFEAGDLRKSGHDANVLLRLQMFPHEEISEQRFSSLAVLFPETPPLTEPEFEEHLWTRLNNLHQLDRQKFSCDADISEDPQSPDFGMSFGGHGFYVIGMHPGASRMSRRTPCATLIFNPHKQFDLLRQAGHYDRIKAVVRNRDIALQGHGNPMLADHGERSEAVQYSGRMAGGQWQCPFKREVTE